MQTEEQLGFLWQYLQKARQNQSPPNQWENFRRTTDQLGLGLEPTLSRMNLDLSYSSFRQWALQRVSNPDNRASTSQEDVLSESDLSFFDEQGYLVVRKAAPAAHCQSVCEAIWELLETSPLERHGWYKEHPAKQGIMLKLYQHPALEVTRKSPLIRKAYEQLWGTKRLYVSTDRVSFNPPETNTYRFPGPYLHWDLDGFTRPIPFGLQGLLYLNRVEPEQGAFSLVPGFHKKIDHWLASLPGGVDPQSRLGDFKAESIAGEAGDFIIWQQALPHGSKPNTCNYPRMVQYINWLPL